MKLGRDEPCLCGSTLRFKHCCGKSIKAELEVSSTVPGDATLLQLVLEADEEGLQAGEVPKARAFKNLLRVVHRIRPNGGTVLTGESAPLFVQNAQRLITALYRSSDIGMGSLHVGAIMFRDIFARVHIPIAWGQIPLDPLVLCDLSDNQKRWLCSCPRDFSNFLDQFLDLVDFAYGSDDLDKRADVRPEVREYANLSHFQLEAAAATVTGGGDLRGAVQGSLLAAELALKAAMFAVGASEMEVKKEFGHDQPKIVNFLHSRRFPADHARLRRTAQNFPALVANRYSKDQPTRVQTGHILMGAQYIASEIIRGLTNRNIRQESGVLSPRYYPPP